MLFRAPPDQPVRVMPGMNLVMVEQLQQHVSVPQASPPNRYRRVHYRALRQRGNLHGRPLRQPRRAAHTPSLAALRTRLNANSVDAALQRSRMEATRPRLPWSAPGDMGMSGSGGDGTSLEEGA
ncbi:MAG: hypothetical protein ACYYK0_03600 [Candidatus Eutrophobiaceae bacterium]